MKHVTDVVADEVQFLEWGVDKSLEATYETDNKDDKNQFKDIKKY